jgi:hypothetical protein
MSSVNVFRVRAALRLPRREAALLAFVLMVIQKMTNNPNFTSPGTVVTALAAAVAAFQTAVQNTSTVKDVGDARTAAKQAVVEKILLLQAYINGVVAHLGVRGDRGELQRDALQVQRRAQVDLPPGRVLRLGRDHPPRVRRGRIGGAARDRYGQGAPGDLPRRRHGRARLVGELGVRVIDEQDGDAAFEWRVEAAGHGRRGSREERGVAGDGRARLLHAARG